MLRNLLYHRTFMTLLLIINVLGTIYGYIWYEGQLAVTPPHFLLFVPDSPTASLFFCLFLFFYLSGRKVPYIEALAVITLFKYGVWAVVMNILTLLVDGYIGWVGYMLIASHGAMAIQGLLYAPLYTIRLRHIMVAAVWTLHNDVIDYVFGMMPTYSSLSLYMKEIGYFTFWLSVLSIAIAYLVSTKKSISISYNP
ncbi:DUF1405 domain-containing protein [Radiobacillus kanasensis]|uniref:DUF1405 domain-containing protein n=1 Tax=Radiobacillus kanasensis TaxID=2844358 RepID=UPI001E310F3A|nr:DUF1405 domain-containing protein [Radiobacillus kanasensis]UFU01292.1 DUF1405 domain-containing protein [Radiobacillus kanasensis]